MLQNSFKNGEIIGYCPTGMPVDDENKLPNDYPDDLEDFPTIIDDTLELTNGNNKFELLVNSVLKQVDRNSPSKFLYYETSTPMIYQALVNILHYQCGYELEVELKQYLDDPKKYYKIDDFGTVLFTPADLLKVNDIEHISAFVKHGIEEAKSKELNKLTSKYKLSVEDSIKAEKLIDEIFDKTLFKQENDNAQNASNELRSIIIQNRLTKYLNEEQKEAVDNVKIQEMVLNGNTKDFILYLKEFNIEEKVLNRLEKSFSKFLEINPDLEKVENKVIDLVKSELHSEIASEIRIFNDIHESTFYGDEILWRGLVLHKDFDINNLFENDHRAIKQGGFLDYHIVNQYSGNLTYNGNAATSTSFDLSVSNFFAQTYYDYSEQEIDYIGYLIEIHPKPLDKAVLMLNYDNQLYPNENEFAFEQISYHNIYAIHKLTYELNVFNDKETDLVHHEHLSKVESTFLNPYYIKREADMDYQSILPGGCVIKNPHNNGEVIIINDGEETVHDQFTDSIRQNIRENLEFVNIHFPRDVSKELVLNSRNIEDVPHVSTNNIDTLDTDYYIA